MALYGDKGGLRPPPKTAVLLTLDLDRLVDSSGACGRGTEPFVTEGVLVDCDCVSGLVLRVRVALDG